MTSFLDPDTLVAAADSTMTLAANSSVNIGGGGQSGASAFFESDIGQSVGSFLGAMAIIVVILTVVLAMGPIMKGQIGKALKIIAGGLLLAGIMFAPEMFTAVISAVSGLVGKMFSSFGSITGQ